MVTALLALVSCAAPLPVEAFPDLGRPPVAIPSAPREPLGGPEAIALATRLGILPRSVGDSDADETQTLPFEWDLRPIGRVRLRSCELWFLVLTTWSSMDSGVQTEVVFTSRKGSVTDVATLARNFQAAGRTFWKARLDVRAGGAIGVREVLAYMEPDALLNEAELPQALTASIQDGRGSPVVDRVFHVETDGKLRSGPKSYPRLAGRTRAASCEWLWLVDDGKTVLAYYSAKGCPSPTALMPLTVESADRDAGALTVRFPKSKQAYPLSWNADHSELRSRDLDGGVQAFTALDR